MNLLKNPNIEYVGIPIIIIIIILLNYKLFNKKIKSIKNSLLNWIQFKIEMNNYDKKAENERRLYRINNIPLGTHRIFKHGVARLRRTTSLSYNEKKKKNEDFRNKWDKLIRSLN